MQHFTSTDLAVLALELIPAAVFGLAGDRVARLGNLLPRSVRLILPVLFALPYVWISYSHEMFLWRWFALYAAIPLAVSWLLEAAAAADPDQRGTWRDVVVLLALGLAVDLRWLEGLWPNGLAGLGKLLLVDAGLYGFVIMRQLRGTGFDFHFRWSDWKTGLRELAYFAPIVIGLGLTLGFLHPHTHAPRLSMLFTWVYIFIFVAVPEELFFRAWVQNLLENRFRSQAEPRSPDQPDRRARILALVITSVLFGLSHFNKRSTHFNWRYVILATIAGIFYGRAWRQNRRVPASSITHATIDTIWSLWF